MKDRMGEQCEDLTQQGKSDQGTSKIERRENSRRKATPVRWGVRPMHAKALETVRTRRARMSFPEIGVRIQRSTLNTPRRKRARKGHVQMICEAGEGLYATRDFKAGEWILDYRYKQGKRKEGDEVDMLSKEELQERYPPTTDMPHGTGTHVLHPQGKWYYDTARSGGVGGKLNTRPGQQNARFRGAQVHATAVIRKGDEIYAPYTYKGSYTIDRTLPTGDKEGWEYVKRGKRGGGGITDTHNI